MLKKTIAFLLVLITTFIFTGSVLSESNILKGTVEKYDPEIDYFPKKAILTHTKVFSIEYHKHYKIVTVHTPWRGADTKFRYILVQRGTPAPDGYENAEIIEVPVKNIVTLSTTFLPHLDSLDLLDRLVGVDSFRYVNTTNVCKLIEEEKLVEVGWDANVNVEIIMDLEADLVMATGSGNPMGDSHPKLQESGIKVVINSEYMDTSPLGRTEWIKYIAAFFNKEAKAEEVFGNITKEYNKLTDLTKDVKHKPTVFTNADYNGTWYVPGGESYAAKFLEDAGANYLWSENKSTGGIPMDFEAVFERAADADFWLNAGVFNSLKELLNADERYKLFAAYKKGNIYNNVAILNEYGGNDYWETGVANPHLVLADLIKIFHPDLLPEHHLIWYKNLK
ncbi:ABC transporter substrate-binding protein [Candidatus Poribacteria bacterium]|nr:ABC transporter substrate-binding protein [Candidatus Poribacteria bacterium]